MPYPISDKQAKAMELIRNGVKPTVAMKKAGYSDETSQAPGRNLLRGAGAKTIIEQYKDAYAKFGITPQYMAAKTVEWLQAEKVQTSHTEPDKMVPDYATQTKAAEMVRKDWGMVQEMNINIDNKILVMPSEIIDKYEIPSSAEPSSER